MSRLFAQLRRDQLAHEHAAMVAKALLESGSSTLPAFARSAAADERRLRGIPVIGGVGGHIPGTRPEQAVERMDRRRGR